MRVLAIDDARVAREHLRVVVELLGHAFEGTGDAEAGVRSARLGAPDAIVVDGRLAGGDVADLVARLRACAPSAAILVLAALDETALVRRCLERGASGAFRRPLVVSEISRRLADIARARRDAR